MKRVGAPASRQHVTHSDWDSCVSDPPHGCVGGFVSGPAPASQAPAWHPPRSVVPPTQRAEVSAAGICVCAWLQRLAVPVSSQARALPWELQGAQGSEQALSPGPGGGRTAGKNSRRQSPSTPLQGPSRALATSTHCRQCCCGLGARKQLWHCMSQRA